ncbi:MAG: GGDEF domain-containing protein [Alphaproteobacteria bacterium]|nr:GGDEF domain-containing protein [Alphaproteobacteria bacterium]
MSESDVERHAVKSREVKKREDAFLAATSHAATFAFQPIVNIHTGRCIGFEALLRNINKLGYKSISSFFDHAWNLGVLHRLDILLRRIAISQFSNIDICQGTKLFFNIDGRCFDSLDSKPYESAALLKQYDIPPENFILELSGHIDNMATRYLEESIQLCDENGFKLAIDDFGRGFSEVQMLYEYQPNFIKIDRFFISDLAENAKKRLFVSSIVNLAHVLGVIVVAKGVETEREFLACKNIGCDLVQGYFIASPTTAHDTLLPTYSIVAETNALDRRQRGTDEFLIRDFIKPLQALSIHNDMNTVFEEFRRNKDQSVFPVLGDGQVPQGIVREGDLKDFIYLQYGRELLQNRALGRGLKDFLTRCPIVDINTEVEKILEIYATGEDKDGILITEDFCYVGFLTADALLRILNEKNMTMARDQNPLTKLPGNNSVVDYLTKALEDTGSDWSFIYFDFNDFKPFNDIYGFRQGDRAIMLFADILQSEKISFPGFLGHVGGDDFFAGFKNMSADTVRQFVVHVLDKFKADAEGLYLPEHRANGKLEAKDRHGQMRSFSLLSCAAAVVHLTAGLRPIEADELFEVIAIGKKAAKQLNSGLSIEVLNRAIRDAVNS